MRLLLFLALAPALAWCQLDSGIVRVTATTAAALSSRATLTIVLSMPPAHSFAEAAAILQPAGVTAASLSNISSYSQPDTVDWVFSLDIPLNSLNDRLATLVKIQASLDAAMTLRYQTYRAPLDGACNIDDLLSAARTRAAQLAVAAGGRLGPVQSLQMPATDTVGFPTAVSRIGFLTDPLLASSWFGSSPVPCTLSVEFSLSH